MDVYDLVVVFDFVVAKNKHAVDGRVLELVIILSGTVVTALTRVPFWWKRCAPKDSCLVDKAPKSGIDAFSQAFRSSLIRP